MKARVAALATAVLTMAGFMAAFTPGPASASQTFPGNAVFSAYSTGTQQHVHAIQPTPTRVVDVDTSLSSAAVDSTNLKPLQNETQAVIVPANLTDTAKTSTANRNSYGRGAAAEVGLGTDTSIKTSDQNQVILSKLLESVAPPSSSKTATDQLLEVPGDPLLYAKAAYEHTSANWNAGFCPLGQPLSYGDNSLAQAELLNIGSGTPALGQPNSQALVKTNTQVDPRQANFTKSYTYLFPNGDGTFGVGSLTHMTIAPITIGNQITVEVLGTWTLRAESTGKAGGNTITFNPEGNGGDLVLRLLDINGVELNGGAAHLTVNDILGKAGVTIPANPLLSGTIATQPHAIGGALDSKPVTSGTEASAAVDVLNLTAISAPGFEGANVRLGHMEAKTIAPPGGLDCPLPVSKTFGDASGTTLQPGQGVASGDNFTWKITFPSIDISKDLACTLTNVTVTDVADVVDKSPTATITGADHGGVIGNAKISTTSKGTITWHLPDYKPGDPPVVLTVNATIPATSTSGVIRNTANVTATLSKCTGGVAGQDFVGNAVVNGKAATINGTAVAGTTNVLSTLSGPKVAAAGLAATGQRQPWLPVAGGGLLLGALALMRSRRRLKADQA
ncbi:MAG: hypothetical protein JWP02_697 [Acidimicrobiales bacterium]|nr:hypothetical protein [Acidimicrobiales bacterium]